MIIEVGSVKTHNSVSRDYTTTPVDVNLGSKLMLNSRNPIPVNLAHLVRDNAL
ncbi:hypothetical protein MTR_4g027980 [Medicago truncatula]|uniref:Uncharacterized protein n=1 Tax=Medicago truncatula TaxID=3880 RepID=G7JI98_MEDTR|nr:hypothetical protein MTR_4g027980 [Medicago truncatula]